MRTGVDQPVSERDVEAYIFKARESLAGAVSECANGRYNNCANRAYYACFQAAISALIHAGITPPGRGDRWRHEFVQARFVGDLINRRRRYPAAMREPLYRLMKLRQAADYETERVSARQAPRGLERAGEFVDAVTARGTTQE
jgi:uncharacterized protein (UPF0332 family)